MTFASSNTCLMLQMLQNYYCAPSRVAVYCDECVCLCVIIIIIINRFVQRHKAVTPEELFVFISASFSNCTDKVRYPQFPGCLMQLQHAIVLKCNYCQRRIDDGVAQSHR